MTATGFLPASDLRTIPGSYALVRADLLPQVVALQGAFLARWGWLLAPTGPWDGYRPYSVQVRTFLARYAPQTSGSGPFGDVRWWGGVRYVRFSALGSAAVPGTSNHGRALAIDWSGLGGIGSPVWSWMMDVAPRCGFVNPLWARDGIPGNGSQEPWHWEAAGAVPVSSYRSLPGAFSIDTTTIPLNPLEDDMTPEQDNLLRHTVAMLTEVPARTAQAVMGWPVSRVEGHPTTFLQDTVNTGTKVEHLTAVVDPDGDGQFQQAVQPSPGEFAAAIAPHLSALLNQPDTVRATVESLEPTALASLAQAVADVADQRARDRLAR